MTNTLNMQSNVKRRMKLKFIHQLLFSLLITLPIVSILVFLSIQTIFRSHSKILSYELGSPVAVIGNYIVDRNGYIVKTYNGESLPIINMQTNPINFGDRIQGSAFEKTISLIDLLNGKGIPIQSSTIYHDSYLELTISDTIRVLYSTDTDTETLISSLQSILPVFTIEGVQLTVIDFRFDKPVIHCRGICPKNALSQE